jgi:hypothetical protein
MSTRGTYKIDGTLCYNHHDNYPSGAAFHMLKVINKCNSVDLFSCIRGMERLELTSSIYDGRAEYHYVIKGGKIECYKVMDEKDDITYLSGGPVETWVTNELKLAAKQYAARGETIYEEGEDERDITVINYRGRYYTKRALENQAKQKFNWAKQAFERGHVGNSSNEFSEAFRLINTCGIDLNELKEEYLLNHADQFAESYGHKTPDYFRNYVNEKVQ